MKPNKHTPASIREPLRKYWAKTKKGGFEVLATSVKEAWVEAKKEAKEINEARKEIGMRHFNYHECAVIKILKNTNHANR